MNRTGVKRKMRTFPGKKKVLSSFVVKTAVFRSYRKTLMLMKKGAFAKVCRMYLAKPIRYYRLHTSAVLTGAVLVLALFSYYAYVSFTLAASAQKTISTQADWEAGEFWNNTMDTTTTAGALQIKAGGVGTWDPSTPGSPENTRGSFNLAPQSAVAGADLATDGSYVYMIWGGNQPNLSRYNPDTNTWKQLADAPTPFSVNSAITHYNGKLYAINGHDGTVTTDATGELYEYDIATDVWTKKNNAPDAWGTVAGPGGSDIRGANNGKLYAVQGNAQTGFWQFDTVTGLWSDLAPVPDPVTASNSHPLVFSDKSFVVAGTTYCSTGCMYVFLGASVNFYRYDIAINQWYTTGAAPLTPQIPAGLGSATTGSALTVDQESDIIYAFRGANMEFMKYTVGDVGETVAGVWDALTADTQNTQRNVTTGASLVFLKVNGVKYVYGLTGGIPDLIRYDIGNNKWDSMLTQNAQGTNAGNTAVFVPSGTDCADPSGCIFAVTPGGVDFRRFDISLQTWTPASGAGSLTDYAANLGAGGGICYDGNNNIYIAQGGTTAVYRYQIGTNDYAAALGTPAALGVGASITCTANDHFYILCGGATTHFYYYDGATLASDDSINTNGLPYQSASYGAALANDGTYVYALIGNGRGTFLRFDPSQAVGSRWTERTNLPTVTSTAAQTYHSVMAYDSLGNIYAIAGKYQKDFWRFDVSENTWTRAADLPMRMAQSMTITPAISGSAMYILRGWGGVSMYKFNPTNNNYITTATWVSEPVDLDFATDFTTFSANHPTAGTSSISFAIRSSTDRVSWSAWENIVTGANGDSTNFDMASVTTPNRRYVQVKATLTSDGASTPVLQDFTVTYENDSTAPANPTIAAFADSSKATSLVNGNSYFYTNPYFEFTPAAQTESPISGYYAAWTADANFNPADTGTHGDAYFQESGTYLVRRPMTRTGADTLWYLRMATKDQSGNVSATQTVFSYRYTGINDAAIKVWSSQAEFTATGTTLTSVEAATSPGNVKLSAVVNGAWTTEAALPFNAAAGSSIVYVPANGNFYLMQGASRNLRSYNATTKLYSAALGTYPVGNVGTGASMIFVSPNGTTCTDSVGCIFGTRGGGTATFGRFNIGGGTYGAGVCGGAGTVAASTWTTCTNATINIGAGGSVAYNGSDTMYALMGGSTAFVYKYTLSTDTWASLSNVDNVVGVGGSLVYAPNGSGCSAVGGCLFATRGAANNTHFYKGSIAANGVVTWAYAPNTPTIFGDGASVRRVGTLLYYDRGNLGNEFYQFDIATSAWTQLSNAPTYFYQGSEQGLAYNSDNNFLYGFRGYSETSLFAYDVRNDTWKRTPSIPNFYTQNGFSAGVVAYDSSNGIMYVARGGGFTDFWSYTASTNLWKQLADVPHTVTTGADAEFVDHTDNAYDGVYLLAGAEALGDNITYAYRYNPQTNIWSQLSYKDDAGSPANIVEVGAGADLIFDGANSLYTAQGGTTAFLRYNILTNNWTVMSAVAGNNDPLPVLNGSGSCAVKMNVGGTDYIYLTRAGGQANVYRYNLTTLAWDAPTAVSSAPGVLTGGDTCVPDGQGNILFPQGSTNTNMYVLDPDGNVSGGNDGDWSTRTVPQVYTNGALVQGANNTILGFRGASTSAMNRYVVATGSSGYEQNGTWISEIIDFNAGQAIGLYGYAGLQVTMTDATDAYETVETRTCSDAGCAADANDAHWSAWTAATNQRALSGVDYYSVASATARYGQARIRLTSDQVLTPTIQDMQWSYYVDSTAPNNPTAPVGAYTDSTKVTSITNNSWANDVTPYFEWTSSDDANGIGIEGYYVYFGTDISKDPLADANDVTNLAYRNGTNYYTASGSTSLGSWNTLTQSASALTNGVYYLRIKTKDRNGNTTASPVDAFTFRVDGSVPNNITDLSVQTYMLSTDTFSFSWTEPVDVGPSGINQYCYHTGVSGDTCVNRTTICSGSTCTVSPVAHYQNRVNTFYVKARDLAINDASSYASTGYFYTGGPPLAPASVTVTPGSQTDTNAFTVGWNLPATCLGSTPCAAADILRYCYTINEEPSPETCGANYSGSPTPSPDGGWTTDLQTSSRQLPNFSAATIQGANIVYVVAMDVVNNIDYDNFTTQTYNFTSNAPGPPAGLTSTDSSDRAANRYSITLTWDEPEDVGSGVQAYKVYRCTSSCDNPDVTDDPPANYTMIATVNTLGYLDTSLNKTITYSYFVRATGTGGNISGNSAVIALKPEGKFKSPPAMSGTPTSNVRIRSAVITWLTQDDVDQDGDAVAHPASSYIQYGTTTGYGAEEGTSDLVSAHSVTLTDLLPNTTYHYRAKWVDVDSNTGLSTDYVFTTLGAPSAPTQVTATPSSGSVNSFLFSWTAPADEGVTVASYRYSVNSTPTAENTLSTTLTTVPAYSAATRQGANTFYVVAVDDGGNVNYSNYGSVDFTAYTTPPSPPLNITITDSSDRDAKRYSITLTWDRSTVATTGGSVARAAGDESIFYTISRSTDNQNFSEIATITSTGYLDTGLDSTATYYYKVTARDKAQATSDSTKVVSETPEGRYTQPPAITTAPVITPDSYGAEVVWGTERVASSFVLFGNVAVSLNEEQGTGDLVADHTIKVTGLLPLTTYYYQVKSIDVDENIATSDVGSFTTLEAPKVSNVKITDVRLYDATVTWTTNKEATTVVNYGTSANYGLTYSEAAGGYSLNHTVKLEGIKDSTTYHFRLAGEDRSGNPISSDDYTFITLTFPKVSDVITKNKSEGQTEIFWTTNVPTTSQVEYYADNIAPKTQGNTALVNEHSILLYGLEDATLYRFKVRGADEFGYEAISTENEFTTLEDTTVPEV
ncbi:MAG: hypothetical protein WC289_02765, partial [Patescibacteria group bacterium]